MKRFCARLVFAPTLAWNVLLGRVLGVGHWWDEVDRHVLIGAFPFPRDVARLHELGVRGVVNACLESTGPVREYQRLGVRQLWLPTADYTTPSLSDVRRATAFIREFAERGQRVYVHCKAGRGRSAAIVLCWLIERRGMSAEQAQAFLQVRRPSVHRNLAQRPLAVQFQRALAAETQVVSPEEAAPDEAPQEAPQQDDDCREA